MAADSAKPTPFERFEEALRKVLSVPKSEVDKDRLRRAKERDAKQAERESKPHGDP